MQSRTWSSTESGSYKFFRSRLLILPVEEIGEYIESLDQEANAIRSNSLRLAWLMRGGLTYDQVLALSYTERKMISKIAEENMETTNKTKLPYF